MQGYRSLRHLGGYGLERRFSGSNLTSKAITANMTVEQVLDRLRSTDIIDGLAVCAPAPNSKGADYDLLILSTKCRAGMMQIFTYIQSRMTDVLFLDIDSYDEVLEGSRRLLSYSIPGIFLKKLERAEIVHDRSRRLARSRNAAVANLFIAPSPSGLYATWFGQNFGLAHLARMLQSSDAEYCTAWDVTIGSLLSKTLQAYLEMRGASYTGDKDGIRYLSGKDPEYLGLMRDCLAASDRHLKFDLYRRLVCRAVEPFGPVWTEDVTAAAFSMPLRDPSQVSDALNSWETLFL